MVANARAVEEAYKTRVYALALASASVQAWCLSNIRNDHAILQS